MSYDILVEMLKICGGILIIYVEMLKIMFVMSDDWNYYNVRLLFWVLKVRLDYKIWRVERGDRYKNIMWGVWF